METLCRLCGKANSNSINILDSCNENLKLEIYNLLRIEIHQSDFLPTKVCSSCVTAVKEASTFINCCHHVQKILEEKYEADCQNPKDAEQVPQTSSTNVPIPSEVERNRNSDCNEEHPIILEMEHRIFVEEPKKLTFVDPDEFISEITSDPLESESSISDNVNENSSLLETSSNILFENGAESNVEVMQNEPIAPQFEISGMPHSFDASMNVEEFPTIKSEPVELDDCFAPDSFQMESNETYVTNSESPEKITNVEVVMKDVSTVNTSSLESTKNIASEMPVSLHDEVLVETNQSYQSNSTNFPTKSNDNIQNIVKQDDDKSMRSLLCVRVPRISDSEYQQKSARNPVTDSDDEMHEPDTSSSSNEMDEEEKIIPTPASLYRINFHHNLMSLLTSQKDSVKEEIQVDKKLDGMQNGIQIFNQDQWKDYFMSNTFRREANISAPHAVKNNIVLKKFKTPVRSADREDGTSNESDPQKLYNYCMEVAKQLNLKNFADEPRADSRGCERLITSQIPQSKSEKKFVNPRCGAVSSDPTTAQNDGSKNSLVSNKTITSLKCEICGRRFRSKSAYEDHLNMHTGYRPFECEICSKTYSRRSDLTAHSRIVHARGQFKCSLCDYVASYEGRLKVHLKTSHEKPFSCNVCDYRCGIRRRIQEHITNKHQKSELNPPEVCELCGGSFKGKLSLRAHQQIVHFPEPQICSACGKRCPNQSVYKAHAIQCGKEKIRYTCDMCGRTYSKKAALKEHMNKHLNIKPYECKLCNKQFFLRVRLIAHMAVHRAPTFQCEVCDRSFNRKDNMKSHMKKHFENGAT